MNRSNMNKLEKKVDQLDLGITEDPSIKIKRLFGDAKVVIKRRSIQLEVSTLWKSPALAFAVASNGIIVFLMLAGLFLNFSVIPPKVPLIYDNINQKWIQTDKSVLFIFLGIVVFLEVLLINISIRVFRFDRRYAITLWWVMFYLNLLLFLAMSQIYLLIS